MSKSQKKKKGTAMSLGEFYAATASVSTSTATGGLTTAGEGAPAQMVRMNWAEVMENQDDTSK